MKRWLGILCAIMIISTGSVHLWAEGTPAPSATPDAQATPEPEEAADDASGDGAQGEPETQGIPAVEYTVNLQYDRYATWDYYYTALRKTTVHAEADKNSQAIGALGFASRTPSEAETQEIDGVTWLGVTMEDGNKGYVDVSSGEARAFRKDRAAQEIAFVEEFVDTPFTVRISNYRNANGMPPALASGTKFDQYENRREAAAPCYEQPDNSVPPVRYAPDGLLGIKYEEFGGYTRVFFPSFDNYYWIPDKYVATSSAVFDLTQAIVVDRKFQNIMMYEKNAAGNWEIIGMNYATTGKQGGTSLRTPLGHFTAIERKQFFYFDNEGDGVVDGYALWSIRFSAGGYTHGVPASSKQDPETGKVHVGGSAEGQSTLGTTPLSHMCVRNYTSFAKFMYDRVQIGHCSVIVFD